MPTALKRRQPTFSFRKSAENSVRIKGSAKNTAMASASGIYLTAVKKQRPPNPINAPRSRLPIRCEVASARKPPTTRMMKNISQHCTKNRMKVAVAGGKSSIMASHLPMASISGNMSTERTMKPIPFTCASTPPPVVFGIVPPSPRSDIYKKAVSHAQTAFHQAHIKRFDFRLVSGANPASGRQNPLIKPGKSGT
ncbi:hypothetical protein B3286c2_0125 [Brucella vulpis]|nr:hypothetical protein BF3285c2_0125 [Brucella vulpis]CUW51147.1 hypothetical protein B3286c2_0125 [Brucella vulpis]